MTLTVIYDGDGRILALTAAPLREPEPAPAAPRGGLTPAAGQRSAEVEVDDAWRTWTLQQIHERCVVEHREAGVRLRARAHPGAAR